MKLQKTDNTLILPSEIVLGNELELRNKIYTIRGVQAMLDSDLAQIYGYDVKALNQQVKRNIGRFPPDFMFQLAREDVDSVKSQFVTSPNSNFFAGQGGGTRKLPYAFTEQGVYMLATVLRGELAERQSVVLMRLFREMRLVMQKNSYIFNELESIRSRILASDIHHKETDKKIGEIFNILEKHKVENTQGIFFQGQIFDAYAKFENFIAQAKKEIVLIDGYVDLSVLERLVTKKDGVSVKVYTSSKAKLKEQDVKKFNEQYPQLDLKYTEKMHDRFLIIDNKILYHIGASLKDLGKKCFAFDLMDSKFIADIMGKV